MRLTKIKLPLLSLRASESSGREAVPKQISWSICDNGAELFLFLLLCSKDSNSLSCSASSIHELLPLVCSWAVMHGREGAKPVIIRSKIWTHRESARSDPTWIPLLMESSVMLLLICSTNPVSQNGNLDPIFHSKIHHLRANVTSISTHHCISHLSCLRNNLVNIQAQNN